MAFWGSCSINMPLLTELSQSLIPPKTALNRIRQVLPGCQLRRPLPEPTYEANRCDLRHVTPRPLQKALYVGLSQIGRPLQVVCLGWFQFPIPEERLSGKAGPIHGLTLCPKKNGLGHILGRSGVALDQPERGGIDEGDVACD